MILLDTHAFVWLCVDPKRLSAAATAAIRNALASGGIAIASITLWEIAMMPRLRAPDQPDRARGAERRGDVRTAYAGV